MRCVFPIPGGLTSDDDPNANRTFDAFNGIKEFFADFNTRSFVLENGVSITRRPDAITFDYLKCYTIGPNDIGDSFFGPVFRTWRIYTDDGYNVYIERSNDAFDGYYPAALLFSINPLEKPILELDAAFDQNARAIVVCERQTGAGGAFPELWIYWFDPFAGQFVLQNFGRGRAPKCLLDDLVSMFESDILIFYAKDTSGTIVYRQQRDRYAIEYSTGINGGEYTYVEDVFRTKGNRVGLLLARRDPVIGRYQIERNETTLYPYLLGLEPWSMGLELQDGTLVAIVIAPTLVEEAWDMVSLEWVTGAFENIVPPADQVVDPDDIKWVMTFGSGVFTTVVGLHGLYDVDQFELLAIELQGGSIIITVIVHVMAGETFEYPPLEWISGYLGS